MMDKKVDAPFECIRMHGMYHVFVSQYKYLHEEIERKKSKRVIFQIHRLRVSAIHVVQCFDMIGECTLCMHSNVSRLCIPCVPIHTNTYGYCVVLSRQKNCALPEALSSATLPVPFSCP